MRSDLVAALEAAGLVGESVACVADAVLVLGAVGRGEPVVGVELGYVAPSAAAADQAGTRPRGQAAPGSMEAHLAAADSALGAVEAITAVQARLDAAVVLVTAAQTTSVGAALLAHRDVADVGELSRTARERWRSRSKSRVRDEIAPAIGWTPGETANLVGLATAPVAFSVPVVGQMARGQLPWRLARSLWLACQRLEAADAAHIATVLCGDDPHTCVPERLGPDGTVDEGPWSHRAFYAALAREVAKVTGADGVDPADAAAARAAREAAAADRCVLATVGEDGMGSLTILMSAFWVASIKDRLDKAARAARAKGDERTLRQLESDVARTLLAHATVGFADLPAPASAEGGEVSPEDLIRAGWSQELIQALSGLPPAMLQVVVPLIGLHDPAEADLLPSVGRPSTRPDPNAPPGPTDPAAFSGPAGSSGEPTSTGGWADPCPDVTGHTGRDGCPACLPSRRAQQTSSTAVPDGVEVPEVGASAMAATDPTAGAVPAAAITDAASGASPAAAASRGSTRARRRLLWVGQLLGPFGSFISPAQVRELGLAPGTTMARLLVDPADGRCIERSRASYQFDAAMRAQLEAADVTCRAPGCLQPAATCQVDHVQEFGTPGGVTAESNAQKIHTGHHDPKTAKEWDASLAANRDVSWTSLLGRIYRTRVWDYRRYVTLLVDAIETVASSPPQDQEDALNQEVYRALTYRDLHDRLNEGDDDAEPSLARFEEWPHVALRHVDPVTGRPAPGPSPAATADAHARRATSAPADPGPRQHGSDQEKSGDGPQPGSGRRPSQPGAGRRPSQPGAGNTDPQPDAAPRTDRDDWPDQTARCAEPGHDHPRWIGPYGYHDLNPPHNYSHDDWARLIAERLADGTDVPPF